MDVPDVDAIAKEYYGQLDLPAEPGCQAHFTLCVIGLVGAGKSTVLRKVSEQLPLVRVSGDAVRKLLRGTHAPEPAVEVVVAVNSRVVDRLNREGYSVAHDNDLGNPSIREQVLNYNRRLGIPVIWIRVTAPEPVILERLRRRERGHFAGTDEAVARYWARKQLHESQAKVLAELPYVYTFDTSAPDLDQQVAAAVQKMQQQLATVRA